jgi:hypothetical protein
MSDDYEIGSGRPPKRSQWKKGQSGNRGRRKARRVATTDEIINTLLLAPVVITENGKKRRVTTLEAIILQLWRKELAGDRRALTVRLKYQELAQQQAELKSEITFGQSPYTEVVGDGQV